MTPDTTTHGISTHDTMPQDTLAQALAAHGGLQRWRAIDSVEATVSLKGLLWTIKGRPRGLTDVRMVASTRQPSMAIRPFPDGATTVGHFTPDRVWIDGDGNTRALPHPRTSFASHVLTTPWDELQELYFTAYAFWNYFTTPFLLTYPGVRTEPLDPHDEAGQRWSRVRATFPASIPTHCEQQVFYFNEKGLLQRIDYVTDVAGGVASHYVYDHATFDGIVVPTLRRVVPRKDGVAQLHGPSAVLVSVRDVVFR